LKKVIIVDFLHNLPLLAFLHKICISQHIDIAIYIQQVILDKTGCTHPIQAVCQLAQSYEHNLPDLTVFQSHLNRGFSDLKPIEIIYN